MTVPLPKFNFYGPKTGRFSSAQPNKSNQPQSMAKFILGDEAPRPLQLDKRSTQQIVDHINKMLDG